MQAIKVNDDTSFHGANYDASTKWSIGFRPDARGARRANHDDDAT
jgi:hypothetical protein